MHLFVEGIGEAHNAPKVGSTITIAKNPSGKGTVVIRKVGDAHPNDKLGTSSCTFLLFTMSSRYYHVSDI